MALYNNGYPASYQQYYQQNYPQFQQSQQAQIQQQTPQVQNGGIVSVPNINYARDYIVMPGTTVTFVDENAPYVYTKTRKSQFDQPIFEKLRLVKEEDIPDRPEPTPAVEYALKSELEELRQAIDALKAEWEGDNE